MHSCAGKAEARNVKITDDSSQYENLKDTFTPLLAAEIRRPKHLPVFPRAE